MINILSQVISEIIQPINFGMTLMGTFVGIIIGALPGLSVNMGIALLFPLTFLFQGSTGILMLMGIYCGAIYGGSISAILLNTPGTPASAATTLDGYPMAVKYGQPGRALGISTSASTFGGIFSSIMLMFFSPLLAKVAVSFSAPEYFALAIFGISIITSVSGKSITKGLIGGVFGLLIATIGLDPMTSKERFAFGSLYLSGGISFVPVLIGLFALSQAFSTIEEMISEKEQKRVKVKIKRIFPSKEDTKLIAPTILRSSLIGTLIGCIPGTGGDISSWISYSTAQKFSKHKEKFGDGSPEGIAASEAGNNSVAGGAMIPLLSLGIPGDGATAIMMGAFMVQGIQLGPLLFTQNVNQAYIVFIGLLLANIFMGILGFSGIKWFAKVINTKKTILVPLIITMCFIGSFSINHNIIDILVMLISGIAAYFLKKLEFSMSPVIIGMILGQMAESNLRRSLILSKLSPTIFITRPICLFFLILSIFSLLLPILQKYKKKKRNNNEINN